MGAMDVLLAFPALLLALAIITFTRRPQRRWHSIWMISLAIGIVSIAAHRPAGAGQHAGVHRARVRAGLAHPGGRQLRASSRKEILPNVMLPVLSFAIIGVAVAIVAEGGLAFLGLSVPPPTATWGSMINEGRNFLDTDPIISLIPCRGHVPHRAVAQPGRRPGAGVLRREGRRPVSRKVITGSAAGGTDTSHRAAQGRRPQDPLPHRARGGARRRRGVARAGPGPHPGRGGRVRVGQDDPVALDHGPAAQEERGPRGPRLLRGHRHHRLLARTRCARSGARRWPWSSRTR